MLTAKQINQAVDRMFGEPRVGRVIWRAATSLLATLTIAWAALVVPSVWVGLCLWILVAFRTFDQVVGAVCADSILKERQRRLDSLPVEWRRLLQTGSVPRSVADPLKMGSRR